MSPAAKRDGIRELSTSYRAKSAAIRDLAADGLSPAQIRDQLGVSAQLVSAALASAGHRGRPRTRPPAQLDVTCPCGCRHTFTVDLA